MFISPENKRKHKVYRILYGFMSELDNLGFSCSLKIVQFQLVYLYICSRKLLFRQDAVENVLRISLRKKKKNKSKTIKYLF